MTPARERQILDAAAHLFHERGFHAVGVDEIGERVGITGPAIYYHFSGKDEILAALFDEALDQLMLRIEGPDDDPFDELARLIRAHAQFTLENRELMGIWAREDRSLVDPWRRNVLRRTKLHVQHWVELLRR